MLFPPRPVRRRTAFRLDPAFFSSPCLKENCFQTRSCFFLLALSEGELLSDLILLFSPRPVRRRTAFRPDPAFSSSTCPKENCFQTRSCFFLLALSEGELLSDPILLFPLTLSEGE